MAIIEENKKYQTIKDDFLCKAIWAGIFASFVGGTYNAITKFPFITVLLHFLGTALLITLLIMFYKNKRKNLAQVLLTYFCFVYTPLAWISLGGLYSSMSFVVYVFFLLIFFLLDDKISLIYMLAYLATVLILVFYNILVPPFDILPTPVFPMAFSYMVMLSILLYISYVFKKRQLFLLYSSHHDSITDKLTGLYNQRFLLETLTTMEEEYIALGKVKDYTIAVLDLDDYKKVNDTYGHSAGDDILHELGQLFASEFHSHLSGRYGGDEFLVIFANTPCNECHALCQSFIEKVSNKSFTQHRINITMSAGVCSRSSMPGGDIFARADELLYAAKQYGKNRVNI